MSSINMSNFTNTSNFTNVQDPKDMSGLDGFFIGMFILWFFVTCTGGRKNNRRTYPFCMPNYQYNS